MEMRTKKVLYRARVKEEAQARRHVKEERYAIKIKDKVALEACTFELTHSLRN